MAPTGEPAEPVGFEPMPLSEDNRALLTLLLARGKSYADIADLLGTDQAGVQERAKAALAEVDPTLPAPDSALADFLLGQADPIARAEAERRFSKDPVLAGQADALADQLRLVVPGARPAAGVPALQSGPRTDSEVDPPPPRRERAPDPGKPVASGKGIADLDSHQRRLIGILLGAALLIGVVVLLLSGVIGGSDDEKSKPEGAPTVAVLQPAPGEQGSGQVQFGFVGTTLAANLQISDLEPSRKGQGYVLWLYGSSGAFPIYATKVGESGSISGRINLNEAVICLVAADVFPSLRLSRADNRDFNAALKQARLTDQRKVSLPEYTGQTVLEGRISMPQSAKDTIVPICNGTSQPARTG